MRWRFVTHEEALPVAGEDALGGADEVGSAGLLRGEADDAGGVGEGDPLSEGRSLRRRGKSAPQGRRYLTAATATLNTFMCGVGCGCVCPEVTGDGLNPLTMR